MNSFLSNLLDRHLYVERNVKPLIRARFDNATDLSNAEVDLTENKDDSVQTATSSSIKEWKPSRSEIKIDRPDESLSGSEKEAQDGIIHIAGSVSFRRSAEEIKLASPGDGVEHANKQEENAVDKKRFSIPHDKKPAHFQKLYTERNYRIDSLQNKIVDDYTPGELGSQIQTHLIDKQEYPGVLVHNESEKDKRSKNFVLPPDRIVGDHQLRKKDIDSKQVINISIGSIEVRANFPAAEPKTVPKKETRNLLSLEQYLEQAKPGSR
jgi:hypothetical protein